MDAGLPDPPALQLWFKTSRTFVRDVVGAILDAVHWFRYLFDLYLLDKCRSMFAVLMFRFLFVSSIRDTSAESSHSSLAQCAPTKSSAKTVSTDTSAICTTIQTINQSLSELFLKISSALTHRNNNRIRSPTKPPPPPFLTSFCSLNCVFLFHL